ncbi:AzlC family ABC transporter permease [Thalassotalea fusca]
MSESYSFTTVKKPMPSGVVRQATLDVMPLALATVPWGILCGSMAIQIGLTALQAQLMSLLVFAGAAQLAALTLMGAGSALSSIYSSTFVISSRHLLYSAVFREHILKYRFSLRTLLAFLLTDEMFALTCAYLDKHKVFSAMYAFVTGLVFYLVWNIATFTGIYLGQQLPDLSEYGLEFAIAATFIAIVVPSIKSKATLCSVIISGGSALILTAIESEYTLVIATILGMVGGYALSTESTDG